VSKFDNSAQSALSNAAAALLQEPGNTGCLYLLPFPIQVWKKYRKKMKIRENYHFL
jgi:hypothetical protein